MTMRFALKAATDDIHRELDDRLSRLDLGRVEDYRRFLEFQARTVPAVEGALACAGLGDFVEGWTESHRGTAIRDDLETLGNPMPPPAQPPIIAGTAELLGTAYVLEGSRLGGRVLRRQVAEGLPASFLGDDGSLGPWPQLLAAIEQNIHSDALLTEAKHAARRSFAWFLQVAHEGGI